MKTEELFEAVKEWAEERNLLRSESKYPQIAKVAEEFGELCQAVLKGRHEETKDAIGDVLVTIIILSHQLGLDPTSCLELAYNEIKDRKGKLVDGSFIKVGD